jgi:hypothetical protein
MSPLEGAQLRQRLASAAKEALDERGLTPDPSALDKIGDLVSVAAEAVESQGPNSADDAADSFRHLARALDQRPTFGEREAALEQVDLASIESALTKLCPGFWPFCR